MAGNLFVCNARNEDGSRGEKESEVVLVQDATAAWQKDEEGFAADLVHKVHVESLKEFASIADTGDVVKLWSSWIKQ